MSLNNQNEVGKIEQLLLKDASAAMLNQAAVDRQWQALGYTALPNFERAQKEYQDFVEILESFGIDIHYAPANTITSMDSLYVRDASIVCNKGIILCNMGKPEREPEPEACVASYDNMGIPIVGAITGTGRVEGGDVAWLDNRTLAIAEGYRTNAEGIAQLKDLLGDCIDELLVVPSPHWNGPGDVFHLMSTLSPIDDDLCLVYSPLLTVPFRNRLLDMGKTLVEVPMEEFDSMGCNVLAVDRRRCLMLDGNPITRNRLEAAGAEVWVYQGEEISQKGCGGPTCLTRPVIRGN